jgi:tight adherence protein C
VSSTLTLVVGLGAVGGAIVLGALALVLGPSKSAETAPANAQAPTQVQPVPSRQRLSAYEEPLPTVMARLRALAIKLSPDDYQRRLQRRLDLAGNPPSMPAERFLALKGVGLVFGALLGLLLGAHHGLWIVVWGAAGAAIGFFLPDVLLRNAGEHRQQDLLRHLPDALDMMTVCVEAGLGFDSSLGRVATNTEGAMAEECARVIQEMQFGKSRAEALRALGDRTEVPEIKSFTTALIQAGELGISIGNVLREQAAEMRVRRRQRAEEKAQKLPVKILLPLISCLLPSMFVVVLGPAAIKIVHTFGTLSF